MQKAYNVILCRYGEIALKGHNRRTFEQHLLNALRRALQGIDRLRLERERGRIILHLPGYEPFTPEHDALLRQAMPRVFGLESCSPGYLVDVSVAAIEAAFFEAVPALIAAAPRDAAGKVSYRARVHRSNKHFPMRSQALEIQLAERVVAEHPELRIDLRQADVDVGIEIRDHWSFMFFERLAGPGGLPVGSSCPSLALLSGGIDSPVACHQMMKRGSHQDFLTFHSFPYTPPDTLAKVCRLVRLLNQYQKSGMLLACNMLPAQKLIRDKCTEKYRTILYRRLMMRIATIVALELGDRAIVTGESLGQVASQTVRNLDVINRAAGMLVLRPLVGFDKRETTDIAARIGTLPVSEIQCADSCTTFAPSSPTTGASVGAIEHEESSLDMDELIRLCLDGLTSVSPKTGREFPFEFRNSQPAQLLAE